eukprot:1559934-Pyramimonas_sp.AAC.1
MPGSLDRKAWSHLGYCTDVELGIDASNLVYNLTWEALVWFLGLGTPWASSQHEVPLDSLPPVPRAKGINHRPKHTSRCTPDDVLPKFPAAWSQETGNCKRHG